MLGLGDIAVADHGRRGRGGFHGFDDVADPVVVHDAGELLLGGSSVDGDHRRAGLHQPRREVPGDRLAVEPAQAQFGGDGHGVADGADNRFDDALGPLRIAQEFGPAVFLRHLVDRAAHVDVDQRCPVVSRPARPIGHDRRIAPVQLHPDRAVEVVGHRQVERGGGAAEKTLGAEQVGAGQTKPALLAADLAERKIAVPGDGGEQQGGGELEGADCEHGGGYGGRCVDLEQTDLRADTLV